MLLQKEKQKQNFIERIHLVAQVFPRHMVESTMELVIYMMDCGFASNEHAVLQFDNNILPPHIG